MIIKGKETDYLVIPLKDLYEEIDMLETELIVRNYSAENHLRIITEERITQLKELIEYYDCH